MRYCLIIDDNSQQEEIELLESISKKRAFPIECYYFNPIRKECLREETLANGGIEYYMDLDLVLVELKKELGNNRIDLIASDYQFESRGVDGLELINFLKQNWVENRDVSSILFSAKHEEIKEKLKNKIDELKGNNESLIDFVQDYYKYYPTKTIDRKNYIEDIYSFLKSKNIPMEKKLFYKLKDHSERTFDNIFPGFEGVKLKTIANIILERTKQSDEFQDEFLDRSVDHFIFLNE